MSEWVRWALGILVPLLVAHGVWATATILQLRQQVNGVTPGNGIKGDVKSLEGWRNDLRADLPKMMERTRHDAVNKMMPIVDEVEERVEKLEERVRALETRKR